MSQPRSPNNTQHSTAQHNPSPLESKEFDFEGLKNQIAEQTKIVSDIQKTLQSEQEKLRNLQYTLDRALRAKQEAELEAKKNASHPNDVHKNLLENFFKASDTYWDLYYKTDPEIQKENQRILQSPGYQEDAGYQSSRPSLMSYQGKEKYVDLFGIVLGKEVMSGARYGYPYNSLREKTVNEKMYKFINENYGNQQKIYQELIQWADQSFSPAQVKVIQDKIEWYHQETQKMQQQQAAQLRGFVRRW